MTSFHESSSARPYQDQKEKPIRKGKGDLLILTYMARKLCSILSGLDDSTQAARPLLYTLSERAGRTHRLAIYRPEVLRSQSHLTFIGFVSEQQASLNQQLIEEVSKVDREMLSELSTVPGLLSYSSLEVRPRSWYNLVLLNSTHAKTSLKQIPLHAYAAYQLAPSYYAWIRLHNGTLLGRLESLTLQLQKTTYYSFSGIPQRLILFEHNDEE